MPRVVLFEPQIPPNTGNIARTCVATGSPLHLIEPLGFSLDDRFLRRAGLDYWPALDLHRHPDQEAFLAERLRLGGRLIGFSSHASEPYDKLGFRSDDWLLFGRESDGLPEALLEQCEQRLRIPIRRWSPRNPIGVRSLNLSVSVAVALFEALRQLRLEDDREAGALQ
ncbi:MAG: tRNA (cytidine(34)-2'-O)-methyltransferase [Synechococcaceae cyanobacterium]|nr:tRNA (cytidine(34)-2'-O)-methyltransferase [Synechococcaceae cyanobacterium]